MYKPAFIHAYKSSKTSLPIAVWAKAIGRRLPQFRNEEDIYSPIPIHVKLAGNLNDSNGAVRLSIMPTNKNWYGELTSALAEMTNERNVDIVNYLGEPISEMSPEQLMAVGECDCVRKGSNTPIRLGAVVAPPLHLSTNKQAELKEWWNSMRSPLAEKIAVQLKGMTMAEIAKATLVDGPIQETIQAHLTQNTLHDLKWDKFLTTYGSGNTDAESMSKKLLDAVRQSLVANEVQIRTHHASIGSEAALWKGSHGTKSQYQDDFTLYRDIIEDAMYHPLVGQQMVHSILHGTVNVARKAGKPKKKKEGRVTKSMVAHPINSYYQTFHFNQHGKLPGHRIAELNRNDGIGAEYPGDTKRVMDAFNLFSGRAVDIEPVVSTSKLMPIEQAVAYVEQIRNKADLIPIECGSCCGHKSKKKDKKKGKDVESHMPDLIPIESVKSPMPDLIPIECGSCTGYKKKAKNVKSRMPIESVKSPLPRLIPISHLEHELVEIPSNEELGEPIWVDDCPNLMDFLRK